MERISGIAERPNMHMRLVERGFPFYTDYWHETVCYQFTPPQVSVAERATNDFFKACVAAGDYIYNRPRYLKRMGIPKIAWEAIARSWKQEPPHMCLRFDALWDGHGQLKFVEANANTPTTRVEAAVSQWDWLEDNWGGPQSPYDQWNGLHDALIENWRFHREWFLRTRGRVPTLYIACTAADKSGEDAMNIGYMGDTARQAGWDVKFLFMHQILKGGRRNQGFYDQDQKPIEALNALYPWEWIVDEPWGEAVFKDMLRPNGTVWIEPPWVMLFNKGIFAVMTELFANDSVIGPLLPRTYFANDPRAKELEGSYIEKPLWGREGAGITKVVNGVVTSKTQGNYAKQLMVRQELVTPPSFGGRYPVLGLWVVGSPNGHQAFGLGIREGDEITSNTARFTPHRIQL